MMMVQPDVAGRDRFSGERGKASFVALLLVIGALVLTAAVIFLVGRGSDGTSATYGGFPATASSENPDKDHWIDLTKEPFHPEWVGGRLVVVRTSPTVSLNGARYTSSDATLIVGQFLSPPLLDTDRLSPDARLVPVAAASLPTLSDDGLTAEWTLREGLTWSDGTPVTSSDVTRSWELLKDTARANSRIIASLGKVKAVEALDARRFRVLYEEAYFRAVDEFGTDFRILPKGLPEDPKEFKKVTHHDGYGAFKVTVFADDRIVLRLKDAYRQKPHPTMPWYIEEVEWRIAAKGAKQVELLKSGEADVGVALFPTWAGLNDDPRFFETGWRTWIDTPTYAFLGWNFRDAADREKPHPILSDVTVRKALGHLVPIASINQAFYNGCARPLSGPFLPTDPAADPSVAPVMFSREKASELLDAAGYKVASSGFREKDGRPLKLRLLTMAGGSFANLAEVFRAEALKVGVEVTVDEVDSTQFTAGYAAGAFDVICTGWSAHRSDGDVFEQFHSQFAGTMSNPISFADGATDSLLEQYRAELSAEKRRALGHQIHQRIALLQPYTFLMVAPSPLILSKRWSNVKMGPFGYRLSDFVLRERRR